VLSALDSGVRTVSKIVDAGTIEQYSLRQYKNLRDQTRD
jgi:hypothetical protein